MGLVSPLYFPGYLSPSFSLSSSSFVPTLHPDSACREVPVSLQAALDRMQKKACQLLLEELLLDLQVRLSTVPEAGGDATDLSPENSTIATLPTPAQDVGHVLHNSGLHPAGYHPANISLPAWLPGLDKPPGVHTMAVACQHHPVSPRQIAPKPPTDRGWEPQPTWASLRSFCGCSMARNQAGERQCPCRGYKPICYCPSHFLPV